MVILAPLPQKQTKHCSLYYPASVTNSFAREECILAQPLLAPSRTPADGSREHAHRGKVQHDRRGPW